MPALTPDPPSPHTAGAMGRTHRIRKAALAGRVKEVEGFLKEDPSLLTSQASPLQKPLISAAAKGGCVEVRAESKGWGMGVRGQGAGSKAEPPLCNGRPRVGSNEVGEDG